MLFSGQFWSAMKGPIAGSASFEALVRREDVSVEELLQSDEVVAAAKRGHPGLMAVLKGMRLSDLISFLIEEDSAPENEQQARRFPFIASEIISSDVPEVIDLFFSEEVFLDQLFSVLQRETLNPVTAGYFCSAATALLVRNTAAVIQYMFGKYDYSRDVVRHAGARAIADFLLRLLKCESGGSQFAFDRLRMLEYLVQSLSPCQTPQYLSNICSILQDIIENGKELKGWKVYMAVLLQSQSIVTLTEGIESDNEGVAKVSAEVLGSLLRISDLESVLAINYTEIAKLLRSKSGEVLDESTSEPQSYNVFALLIDKIGFLTSQLESVPISTVAQKYQNLSPSKLAFVRLLSVLMRNPPSEIVSTLVSSQTICAITDLFEGHIWSSLLHNEFETMVKTIIESPSAELKADLLVTTNLAQRLVSIEPCIVSETKVKTRKGYMGHVTRIGNYLLSATAAQAGVASHLTFNSDWIVFVNEVLQVRNELEEGRLGQRQSESRRYDEEFDDDEEELKEQLSTPSQLYQDLQGLGLQPPAETNEAEDEAFYLEDDVVTYESPVDSSDFVSSVYWKVPALEGELEDLE